MRALRVLVTAAAGSALVAVCAAPVAAANDVHYTGTFTPTVTKVSCTTDHLTGAASGTWRVNVGRHTAAARFVINLANTPHVAFTVPMDVLAPGSDTFKASTNRVAAGPLTVTLHPNGTLDYVIAPYDSVRFLGAATGTKCASVTYHGVVDPH